MERGLRERLPKGQLLIPAHLGEAAAQQHQARLRFPVQLAGQIKRIVALEIKGKQTNKEEKKEIREGKIMDLCICQDLFRMQSKVETQKQFML